MNDKSKPILRQLKQLSQIEPSDEAAERALAHARAKLASSVAEPARSLPSKRKNSFPRSRIMYSRIVALVLACAAFFALIVVFSASGGHGQLAFAQVIEKVQQTRSLSFKNINRGPDGKVQDESQCLVLPDGKMRSEYPHGFAIQDFKAHKMMMVQKESKTVNIFEGVASPAPEFEKINLYEMIRNIRHDAVEHLPDENLHDRKAMVFRVDLKELSKLCKKSISVKVWVDPDTDLPIRMEGTMEESDGKANSANSVNVMSDIEFDKPFDPSLFDFTPPKGYTVQTCGIANFPDLPEKPELRAPEIIPGVGLGPIRFGMSREKIESLLGKPDGYESNETSLLYHSRGFVLTVSLRSGLKSVNCKSQTLSMARVRDFAGKTKEGIGIGSTLQEVEKAFGKPDRDEGHDALNKRLVFDKSGLEIQFVDDKVIQIYLNEVRPLAEKPSEDKNETTRKQEHKIAAKTMTVTVVGPDDKPIAGVNIRDGIWFKKKTAKTNGDHVCDAQGQTVIELPDQLDILRLFTSCDGYVPQFVHWEELDENPPDAYTIKLSKGTTIGGFVKDDAGHPIAGAKVEVMMVQDSRKTQKRTCHTQWLAEGDDARITDAEGRWTLNNVPEGDVKLLLKISHPDYLGDNDWGGLQQKQSISLRNLRDRQAVIVLSKKTQ
jgi:outer membrane lipoprotein-sorting protein